MPLPWGIAPVYRMPILPLEKRIESAADRAISLGQLRALAEYVKRLCKVNILRYPDTGERINWSKVDQYDVVELVIKRVIPQEHSCSWTELVTNGKPQPAEHFVSHWWGEAFRDFMCAIEHHVQQNCLHRDTNYFFCVAANNQWTVELGHVLRMSPFFEALSSVRSTVIILDKDGGVCKRLWCVFEWHETVRMDLPIQVATPMGLVGSPLVSSGPFVDVLQSLRIDEATASSKVDQRRILNHIAGKCELSGLKEVWSSEGSAQLELDPVASGDQYEEQLLRTNSKKFKHFEQQVQRWTIPPNAPSLDKRCSAHSTLSSCLCGFLLQSLRAKTERPRTQKAIEAGQAWTQSASGITLANVRLLAAKVKQECGSWDILKMPPEHMGRYKQSMSQIGRSISGNTGVDWSNVNMWMIVSFLIRPLTQARQCSYAQLVEKVPKRSDYHVCYTWGMNFREIMLGIEWFCEARNLPDTTTFFFPALGYNLHSKEAEEDLATVGLMQLKFSQELRDAVGMIVLLDDMASTLRRIWSRAALYVALKLGKHVDFLCPNGALAGTRPFANGNWEFGCFEATIARRILQMRTEDAVTIDEDQRCLLQSEMCGSAGAPFHVFDFWISSRMWGPALREAIVAGDMEHILMVLRSPAVLADPWSPWGTSQQGPLGQSIVHIAASSGNVEVLEALLTRRVSVNSQDVDGETPLHYATLAGHTAMVQYLLSAKADPELESYYLETPLEVAKQCPGSCLKIDYSRIHDILSSSASPTAAGGRIGPRLRSTLAEIEPPGERSLQLTSLPNLCARRHAIKSC